MYENILKIIIAKHLSDLKADGIFYLFSHAQINFLKFFLSLPYGSFTGFLFILLSVEVVTLSFVIYCLCHASLVIKTFLAKLDSCKSITSNDCYTIVMLS